MQTLTRFEGIFCENDCDYLGKIMPQSTGKLAISFQFTSIFDQYSSSIYKFFSRKFYINTPFLKQYKVAFFQG